MSLPSQVTRQELADKRAVAATKESEGLPRDASYQPIDVGEAEGEVALAPLYTDPT